MTAAVGIRVGGVGEVILGWNGGGGGREEEEQGEDVSDNNDEDEESMAEVAGVRDESRVGRGLKFDVIGFNEIA